MSPTRLFTRRSVLLMPVGAAVAMLGEGLRVRSLVADQLVDDLGNPLETETGDALESW